MWVETQRLLWKSLQGRYLKGGLQGPPLPEGVQGWGIPLPILHQALIVCFANFLAQNVHYTGWTPARCGPKRREWWFDTNKRKTRNGGEDPSSLGLQWAMQSGPRASPQSGEEDRF